jgi:RND superfamily putative drug exporter
LKRALDAFAAGVVRLRYLVIAAWVALTVAAALFLPALEDAQTNSIGDLVATDADAIETEVRSVELFRFPLLSRTIVVQRDGGGLAPGVLARAAGNITQLNLGALPGLESVRFALGTANVLGEPPFSRERSTTALTYLFFPVEIGPVGRTGLAHLYAARHLNEAEDAYVGVTGAAPARAAQSNAILDALPLVELATVLLVGIAMAVHFRAILPSLLNLVAIAISYTLATRVLAASGNALGVVVPPEVEPVIVALLFGVVTDYSIFFLSRFRGRLADGESERDAARRTVAELIPIVGVAGLTVAAATATLALARLGFFQSFGPGLALSVLVALAVSITVVPAALAIGGKWMFWPSRPRPAGAAAKPRVRRLRERLATKRAAFLAFPTRRPVLTIVLTAAPLVILAAFLFRLEVGNRTITSLPADSEARIAYQEASKGFAAGILSPTVVLIEGENVVLQRTELREIQSAIEARAGVAEVVGPGEARLPTTLGAVYSPTGDAARLLVVLDSDPFGSAAIEEVQELGEDLPGLLNDAGLRRATASLAGDTAISAETVTKSREDLVRVMPAATLVVFAILAVFLVALVAPLYLVLTSLLALAASLGLTVLFFQDVLGNGELAFYVPFTATVLLVALGSDYNVYLVGRVWNEAAKRPLRDAVAVAGSRAAGAITTAGLVLAASFAMIALIPISAFQELAFAVSAGLLIDAFVVRSLLTPALITMVGERSGWPGKRLVARVPGQAPSLAATTSTPPRPAIRAPERPGRRHPDSTPSRSRARLAASAVASALAAAGAGLAARAILRKRR